MPLGLQCDGIRGCHFKACERHRRFVITYGYECSMRGYGGNRMPTPYQHMARVLCNSKCPATCCTMACPWRVVGNEFIPAKLEPMSIRARRRSRYTAVLNMRLGILAGWRGSFQVVGWLGPPGMVFWDLLPAACLLPACCLPAACLLSACSCLLPACLPFTSGRQV